MTLTVFNLSELDAQLMLKEQAEARKKVERELKKAGAKTFEGVVLVEGQALSIERADA